MKRLLSILKSLTYQDIPAGSVYVLENVMNLNTSLYFGSKEEIFLNGTYVAVWVAENVFAPYLDDIEANIILKMEGTESGGKEEIKIYKVS